MAQDASIHKYIDKGNLQLQINNLIERKNSTFIDK